MNGNGGRSGRGRDGEGGEGRDIDRESEERLIQMERGGEKNGYIYAMREEDGVAIANLTCFCIPQPHQASGCPSSLR